jgi:cytochrome c oxidase cbb3-type subunit 3
MRIGPMRIGTARKLSLGLAVVLCSAVGIAAQQPAPAARPPMGRAVVDPAAHDRGRALWATHCVQCHGPQARGSDTGPNIIRTKTANYDRSAQQAGSVLGPFLKAGHPTPGASASLTDADIVDLANFLRQRVNDTMRGSPVFTVGDIVTGDAARGEAFFTGAGGCATCHTGPERSLAGIATRIPAPVDLQQRMLFPGTTVRGRAGRARGATAAAPAADRNAITVSIASGSGTPLSGVLVEESDFYVTLRAADGTVRTVRRGPGVRVTKTNPLQAHIDLLDRVTDAQIHDLVAYLETLK